MAAIGVVWIDIMIYVFYGTDSILARQKMRSLVDSLLKKKPDAAYTRITEELWHDSILLENIGSQGLFSDKTIVLLDTLLDTDAHEEIMKSLEEIASSDNIFILLERALDQKVLTKLEKHAEKIQEYSLAEKPKEETTLFGLADAFGRRDKKNLWLEFQKADKKGAQNEEIHGIIFWQLRCIMLASKTDATTSGLKPFVFNKAKQFSKNFDQTELASVSGRLVSMYHDAHRGLVDFNNALEQFVLEI